MMTVKVYTEARDQKKRADAYVQVFTVMTVQAFLSDSQDYRHHRLGYATLHELANICPRHVVWNALLATHMPVPRKRFDLSTVF